MSRTVTGTSTTELILSNPSDNPLTVAATGVIATGTGPAILGRAGVAWSITNSGALTGGSFGIELMSGGTIVNHGAITAASGDGVYIAGGGATLTDTGAITGATGIAFAATAGAGTLTISGAVTGTGGTAISLGGGNDVLQLVPGCVITGKIAGGAGSNTLVLQSGGNGHGELRGLGSAVSGFGLLTVNAGAFWAAQGANTVATVSNSGTLKVGAGGSLSVTAQTASAGNGIFQLDTGTKLDLAADPSSGGQIQFLDQFQRLGGRELLIGHTAQFGIGAGTTAYAGPLLVDFGTADSIDLKDIAPAGLQLAYNSASGLLTFSQGGAGVASLLFDTADLGAGSFHTASDGKLGTLLTHN